MSPVILTKKLIKLFYNFIFSAQVFVLRVFRIVNFPVPLNSDMRITSSKSIRHFYESGIRTYLPIAVCAKVLGIDLTEKINVLDFGCGFGRQLLHFTKDYHKPNYFGCDVNQRAIKFIRAKYPQVESIVNNFDPPLPYESNFFDFVYSVSIFSHLNQEGQIRWLAELARVTKSNGYCFVTTEGLHTFNMIPSNFWDGKAEELLKTEGIIYKEYSYFKKAKSSESILPFLNSLPGISASYGTTVILPSYIRRHWGLAGFEVVNIVEAIIDNQQDLVILQKT